MKKLLLAIAAAALAAIAFVGCSPSEKEFNEQFLTGYWVDGSEYMRFDAAHTGELWNSAEDVGEGEGRNFRWSLSGQDFLLDMCFEVVGECDVPKPYTMVELTQTKLVYKDFTGKTRTYAKTTKP